MIRKTKITFRAWFDGESKDYEVTGQKARTIVSLVQASRRGITALEVSFCAFWLAAYACELRNENALDIQRVWEKHDGGRHGRYILHTPVEILLVC